MVVLVFIERMHAVFFYQANTVLVAGPRSSIAGEAPFFSCLSNFHTKHDGLPIQARDERNVFR
jgi:hypothetical protein